MKRINKNILFILESLSHLKEIYNVLMANKAGIFTLKAEKRMVLAAVNNHKGFTLKEISIPNYKGFHKTH
tara:strand:- start:9105 stop:9314 length:210 start_codon:yes stop_codon:yes gene_type:complete